MKKLAIFLFFFVQIFALPALARDYQIELLVFEPKNPSSESEEQWNAGSNQILADQESMRGIAVAAVNLPLQKGVSRLKRIESELLSSGYRLLVSTSWPQPAEVYQRAPIVNISRSDNKLIGFLKVYKTSLIFVDVNLGLVDALIDPVLPTFFISEKRRVKFKEVHYFDHPKFGAILTVWPVEE
ncbi:MAG: CsiV family protein [Arenicellales bacterium]